MVEVISKSMGKRLKIMKGFDIPSLVHGRLYRLRSRNLETGVWNAPAKGFIGVREKFGSRYLFTEYHYDTGAPFGTATPTEDMAKDVPEGIPIQEESPKGTVCVACDQPVKWSGPPAPAPWVHTDPTLDAGCTAVPIRQQNQPLFDWVKENS